MDVAEFFEWLPPQLAVLIISALPLLELRGAIPIAIVTYDLSGLQAFFWAVLGNTAIALVLLLSLDHAARLVARIDLFKRFLDWLFAHTRRRHSERVERWAQFALFFVVAIPLPMTGAWTGSLVAYVFGMRTRDAFPVIAIGVMTAGVIVTIATEAGLRASLIL